jgi:hypothetical protein
LYPGAPTVDLLSFRIDSMKVTTPTRKRSRTVGLLLYGLALFLVLLAPVLGAMALAVAVWQALVAGSIWYMPLGLVLVLAAIALVQSHRPFDLGLLGLVAVMVIVWFRSDFLQQGHLLDAIQTLAPQTGLMIGVLVVMVVALVLIHAARRNGRF